MDRGLPIFEDLGLGPLLPVEPQAGRDHPEQHSFPLSRISFHTDARDGPGVRPMVESAPSKFANI
jgi:hypothetical protein